MAAVGRRSAHREGDREDFGSEDADGIALGRAVRLAVDLQRGPTCPQASNRPFAVAGIHEEVHLSNIDGAAVDHWLSPEPRAAEPDGHRSTDRERHRLAVVSEREYVMARGRRMAARRRARRRLGRGRRRRCAGRRTAWGRGGCARRRDGRRVVRPALVVRPTCRQHSCGDQERHRSQRAWPFHCRCTPFVRSTPPAGRNLRACSVAVQSRPGRRRWVTVRERHRRAWVVHDLGVPPCQALRRHRLCPGSH